MLLTRSLLCHLHCRGASVWTSGLAGVGDDTSDSVFLGPNADMWSIQSHPVCGVSRVLGIGVMDFNQAAVVVLMCVDEKDYCQGHSTSTSILLCHSSPCHYTSSRMMPQPSSYSLSMHRPLILVPAISRLDCILACVSCFHTVKQRLLFVLLHRNALGIQSCPIPIFTQWLCTRLTACLHCVLFGVLLVLLDN